MTALLKTQNSLGNFLVMEQDRHFNWCRADAAVDYSTANLIPFEVGEVLGRTGPTAAFGRLPAGLTGITEYAILVDERTTDPVFYNHVPTEGYGSGVAGKLTPNWMADTLTMAVMVRGDALVRKDGLTFGGATEADITIVLAALESVGIRHVTQLKGKYSTDRMHPMRNASNDPV